MHNRKKNQINISYFKDTSKENSVDARIPPSDTKDRAGDPVAEVPVLPFMSPFSPEIERGIDSHSISILDHI